MTEQFKVAFNEEQYGLWKELFEKKLTSQTFPEFVRTSYYDAVDNIRLKSGLIVGADNK